MPLLNERRWASIYAGGGGQASVEYTQAVGGGGVLHWSKTFIYAGGSVLATIAPAGTSEYVEYHHPDRLGTRLISNNANTGVQEQETLPYGAAVTASSSTRQFTSYDRSASTGLDYAVNRRYDSLQGRFTQVDPIGASASSLSDPQSWNMYAYCGNDPVNHVDPDGLLFKKLFKAIGKFFKGLVKFAAAGIFVFKAVRRATLKALANKWVQVAIGVALVVLAGPAGAALFGFSTGAGVAAGGIISQTTAAIIQAAAVAGGQLGRRLQNQSPDEEILDDGPDITIHTRICKDGSPFPFCGLNTGLRAAYPVLSAIARFLEERRRQRKQDETYSCTTKGYLMRYRGKGRGKKYETTEGPFKLGPVEVSAKKGQAEVIAAILLFNELQFLAARKTAESTTHSWIGKHINNSQVKCSVKK